MPREKCYFDAPVWSEQEQFSLLTLLRRAFSFTVSFVRLWVKEHEENPQMMVGGCDAFRWTAGFMGTFLVCLNVMYYWCIDPEVLLLPQGWC